MQAIRIPDARWGEVWRALVATGPISCIGPEPPIYLVSDRQGIPLASLQTAANVNEGTVLLDVIDAGPPRRRPDKLHADKAYESQARSAALEQRGIIPRIARKGIESKTKLGRHRWVVERAFAWLHRNRRLLVRYERRDDLHEAFLHLGSILICWHFAEDLFC